MLIFFSLLEVLHRIAILLLERLLDFVLKQERQRDRNKLFTEPLGQR